MDERVQARLQMLREEFDTGERQLADLDKQRAQLMETMLRISGAIQVLEELTDATPADTTPAPNGGATEQQPVA